MEQTEGEKMNREFMKKREAAIAELITLERKHGQDVAVSAMRKRSEFVREEAKRIKGIAKLEGELKTLRDKIERERERGKKR
jgi:methionine synthase II (cobalamin-independent)